MADVPRRLSVGSGTHYADGWTNCDINSPGPPHRDPDVFVSVYQLTDHFPPASFDRAYLGHVLEHLVWNRIPEALRELDGVLAPGGEVMVVGPCILRAVAQREPEHIIRAILADPRDEPTGHAHAWTPTTELTLEAVQSVFADAEVVPVQSVTPPRWPNVAPTALWQCAVHAVKGGGS